jgi:hypothetical protein
MIAITATLAACIAILRFWPDLPLARALHGLLVLPIARRHASLTPGHWLLFGMIGAVLGTVAWLGGDLIVVAAMGSPEIVALLATVEIAAYLDAALATIAVAGALRGTSLRLWVARAARPRANRSRRVRTARKAPANDDDPAAVWALAA